MTASTIYTIGHSNREIKHFISMLHSFDISLLADVRSIPASRYSPQYNKPALSRALLEAGIEYRHMPGLGGKIEGGFSPYMLTQNFSQAINSLTQAASTQNVAYMCAEADWKSCHRSLISEHLYKSGWEVWHISGHQYSEPHMRVMKQGKLFAF